MAGKTIGIVGLGNIGCRVATICHALDMNIIALVRNKNKKRAIDFHVEFVDSVEDLLPRVNFLSIHVPFNSDTEN